MSGFGRMRVLALLGCLMGAAGFADEVTYQFRWEGAGGYEMLGALSYRESLRAGPIVMADDVTCFAIEGRKDGQVIGAWGLGLLGPRTTWRLHFSPATESFVVDGFFINLPQAWNMNGIGDDCGAGGFGFNIGNAAQDICLDGRLIVDSQVAPSKPFPAQRVPGYDFPSYGCLGPALFSRLKLPD